MTIVSIDRDGDIAVVTVDNPPVNALGKHCAKGCGTPLPRWTPPPVARGRADLRWPDVHCRRGCHGILQAPVPPHLPDLVDRIESAAKPWVAAIHGSALGGGFEVAMSRRFRVALENASVFDPLG